MHTSNIIAQLKGEYSQALITRVALDDGLLLLSAYYDSTLTLLKNDLDPKTAYTEFYKRLEIYATKYRKHPKQRQVAYKIIELIRAERVRFSQQSS